MPSYNMELYDMTNGDSSSSTATLTKGKSDGNGGFYVSPFKAFLFILLAAIVAVGVGIIAYVAQSKEVACNYGGLDEEGSALRQCQGWIIAGGQVSERICETCYTAGAATTLAPQTTTAGAGTTATTAVTLSTTAGTPATTTAAYPREKYRLPSNLIPTHYTLKLKPDIYGSDPSAFTFEGSVIIEVECKQATDMVYVHVDRLDFDYSDVFVRVKDTGETIAAEHRGYQKDPHFYWMHMTQRLEAGKKYLIEFSKFTGPLTTDGQGLYYSSYRDGDQTVYLATTQMEAPYARKSFPCYDEPALKATFDITLVRRKNTGRDYVTLSNMPLLNSTDVGEWTEDRYQVTPIMSTYLLAFIVCDYKHVEDHLRGTQYRTWARGNALEYAKQAQEHGLKIFNYLDSRFSPNYSSVISKLDNIAIPDFNAGAMENWGLITYREALLYKPGVAGATDDNWIAEVVAHEIAHMWFGNLVSPLWWNWLWLNEAFASFWDFYTVGQIYPTWRTVDEQIASGLHAIMATDCLASSHPMTADVETRQEISSIFDSVTYTKGSFIIRMMHFIMGEANFIQGLNRYLDKKKFSAAEHKDLWESLDEVGLALTPRVNMTLRMDPWVTQMGYPVVMATKLSNGGLRLTQQRFLLGSEDNTDDRYKDPPYDYKWEIPITYTTSQERNFDKTRGDITWLTKDNPVEISGSTMGQVDWYIVNVQQYGYFRVNYEAQNWEALIRQLNSDHSVIHPINRGQLINDAWNLVKADLLDMSVALKLLDYLGEETDYVPWRAFAREMDYVELMLDLTPLFSDLEAFMLKTVGSPLQSLGLDIKPEMPPIEVYARSLIADYACSYGHVTCVNLAKQQFSTWMTTSTNSIDPNLRYRFYCTAVENGGIAEWNFVYKQFKAEDDAIENSRLRRALACTKEPSLMQKLLLMTLNSSEIKTQDIRATIQAVAENRWGRSIAFQFAIQYFTTLSGMMSASNMNRLIASITAQFNSDYHLTQLQILMDVAGASFQPAVVQARAQTETNRDWLAKHYSVLEAWLTAEDAEEKPARGRYRLPTTVKPKAYTVTIQPFIYGDDSSQFYFEGSCSILVECLTSTSTITLHVDRLTIDVKDVSVTHEGASENLLKDVTYEQETHFYHMHMTSSLQAGQLYRVTFDRFTGPLSTDGQGLYVSAYKDGDRTVYLATTQMEAPYARKTFPCFDEPAMKAYFDFTLLRRTDTDRPYISIFNMPRSSTKTVNGSDGHTWAHDTFSTTPMMPTYLLAFIVCDYLYVENYTTVGQPIPYRTWARPNAMQWTQRAQEYGLQLFEWFNTNFKPDYAVGIPKLDNVAVPDFNFGAMENWGLIIYREAILYQPGVTSASYEFWMGSVIAHEIAHMWFGDFVSPLWWNWLWLNEAFASWWDVYATDQVLTNWRCIDKWIADDVYGVMASDALATSHPITSDVESPTEINAIFDGITYNKGAAILRMIQFIMGKDSFIQALNDYYLVPKHWGNAETQDLWTALDKKMVDNKETVMISDMMDPWIVQMGFPVVRVTKLENARGYLVTQERFLIGSVADTDPRYTDAPYNYKWNIPIVYTNSVSKDFDKTKSDIHWLNRSADNITIGHNIPNDTDAWILVNVDQIGYFRVLYDDNNWLALIKQLNQDFTVIPPINRGLLINDAWNLAKAGMLNMSIALATLDFLQQETEYVPWRAFAREMNYVELMLERTDLYPALTDFMLDAVSHPMKTLTLDIEEDMAPIDVFIRTLIAEYACKYGHVSCVNVARRKFREWKNTGVNEINANLRRQYYCTGVAEGDNTDWEFVYNQYKVNDDTTELTSLRYAMSCSKNVNYLRRLLSMILDPNEIRPQDVSTTIQWVAGNPLGRDVAYQFFINNFEAIQGKLEILYLGRSLLSVTTHFNTEFDLQQLTQFAAAPGSSVIRTFLDEAITQTRNNMAWLQNNYNIIAAWLNNRGATEPPPPAGSYRLPGNLKPVHYTLRLQPNIYGNDTSKFTFSGRVSIDFECVQATQTITLHQDRLTINSTAISVKENNSPTELEITGVTAEDQYHFYHIHLKQPLVAGQRYIVDFPEFTGQIRQNGEGLYLSSYIDNGLRIYLATTQMEPTYARQVFPCFDEPAMKATFDTTLVRRTDTGRDYITLSNMPLVNSVPEDSSWTADQFSRTMIMPTYLLAFIVCDYKHLSNTTERGVISSTYARPNRLEDAKMAQKYGVEVFNWYNRNFEPKYETYNSKVDHIAIPDFNAGAMENWGLITYREALLYNEMSTASDLSWVAEVISHELAHMWFGNKVSPLWWDWLWLNEAFASYWEYYAVWQLYPDWKNYEVELTASVFSAMQTDSYSTSHALNNPVETPDEIDRQFSTITYTKGGAIISMMHFIMGEQFIPGLNEYLKANQQGSADHTKLLSALDAYSSSQGHKINMTLRMEPWIKQKGFPVVTVTRDGSELKLKQERFLLGTSPSSDVGEFGYKYEIPVSYTTSTEKNFNKPYTDILWLSKDQDLTETVAGQHDWVIVNLQHKGYFRVNYDTNNWEALITQLNTDHTVIDEINRATVIDDAFNLVKAGKLDLKIALRTLDYLSKETSYGPWRVFARETTQLDMLIERTDLFPAFQRFMQGVVDTPLKTVGLNMSAGNDPPVDMYTRIWIVRDACQYEHATCVKAATQAVADWMDGLGNSINVNLRSDIYCTAVREGSHDVWDFIFEQYKKETSSATERTRLRNSLGCSKDPSVLRRFLEMCLYDGSIPYTETSGCVSAVAGNRFGRDVAVNFVMEKFPDIKKTFSAAALGSMVRTVAQHFHTNYHLAQIKFLRDTYDVSGITSQLELAEQTTLTNMRYLQNNFDTIKQWLESKAPAPTTSLNYRLPTSIVPRHYDLELQPFIYSNNPSDFNFSGSVSILIECINVTNNITLHAYRLNVDHIRSTARLASASGTNMTDLIQEVGYDEARHFLTFHLRGSLVAGNTYQLSMSFSAAMTGDGVGLYYASYTNGTTVYMATTKFEAPYARRAFPCFDEPALKATFNTTLVRREEYNGRTYNSMSNNERLRSESRGGGYVADIFQTTPKTSTYLLAFIVSDFECLNNLTKHGLLYGTCARPNALEHGELAQEWGVKEMEWLEDKFDPIYPMPKLDNIAIPNFLSGAMENWGLITYREALLYMPNVSVASDKKWMIEVVAHELVHMWFGNIVSPRWWYWLWLNEAFASFFEYHIVDQLDPTMRSMEQFIVQSVHSTMASDSLLSSHPLTASVESPDEIQAIFDSITYNKGAAIVRMMLFIMGEDNFIEALNVYLDDRKYDAADHHDLLNALDKHSQQAGLGLNMTNLMDPWVTQMGYPVVSVSLNDANQISITQKRFLTSSGGSSDEGTYGYKWDIPVTYASSANAEFNVSRVTPTWLYRNFDQLTINLTSKPDWLIVNVERYGFFRVNYEESMWAKILHQLETNSGVIHPLTRAQIINDAWSLAKAGHLNMSIALRTTDFLQNDGDYIPWRAIASELTYLDLMLGRTDIYGKFQVYMRNLVNDTYYKIKDKSDVNPIDIFQRQRIMGYACDYGIENCKAWASGEFEKYKGNSQVNEIDVDMRYIVYCNGIRYGTAEDWEFLLEQYKNTLSSSERSNLQRGLACTREPWLINRLLKLTLDSSVIKPQDVRSAMEAVSANPSGRDMVWTFLKENFSATSKSMTPGNFGRMILYLTQHFNTRYQVDDIRLFMDTNDVTIAETSFKQALEQTALNIEWMNSYLNVIEAWLNNKTRSP